MTIDTLTTFLGWCTLINFCLLAISALSLAIARNQIAGIHARLFDLDPADLPAIYFDFLGRYKLLWIILNLVPWISLEIMA